MDLFRILIVVIIGINVLLIWMRLELKKDNIHFSYFNSGLKIYNAFKIKIDNNRETKIRYRLALLFIGLVCAIAISLMSL